MPPIAIRLEMPAVDGGLVTGQVVPDPDRDRVPAQFRGGPDPLVAVDNRPVRRDLDRYVEARSHALDESVKFLADEIVEEVGLAGMLHEPRDGPVLDSSRPRRPGRRVRDRRGVGRRRRDDGPGRAGDARSGFVDRVPDWVALP